MSSWGQRIRAAIRRPAGIAPCTVALSLLAATPTSAQNAPCLADVKSAAEGELGYRLRSGAHCEGALQRYVSSSSRIALVGYHQGTLDFRSATLTSVPLTVITDARPGPIVLRAMSLTSQSRYQMDNVDVVSGRTFHWPVDLLRQAAATRGSGASISALGVIACSNRCAHRPDTVYWPVAFTAEQRPADDGLSLKLRSGVRAESISVTLEPTADASASHSWRVKDLALTPNGVATVALPTGQRAGLYRLTVDARAEDTSEPVGALHATIYIPGPRR